MSSQLGVIALAATLTVSLTTVIHIGRGVAKETRLTAHATSTDQVVLVTHNSKKELRKALRDKGVEIGSSDTEFLILYPHGCYLHSVGSPTENVLQAAAKNCNQ